MKRLFIVLAAALVSFAFTAPAANSAWADPPGHAKGHGPKGKGHHGKRGHGPKSRGHHDGGNLNISLHFGDESRDLIVDFYDHHPRYRKKYKPLPPGIRKNLAVGKPLPPGIAKQTLPEGLHDRLPPLPEGYARFVVGDTLVVVDSDGIVLDLFVEF